MRRTPGRPSRSPAAAQVPTGFAGLGPVEDADRFQTDAVPEFPRQHLEAGSDELVEIRLMGRGAHVDETRRAIVSNILGRTWPPHARIERIRDDRDVGGNSDR